MTEEKKAGPSVGCGTLLIVAALLILAGVLYMNNQRRGVDVPGNVAQRVVNAITTRTENYSVPAGRFMWLEMSSNRIHCDYKATGGRNDIKAYVVDAQGLANLQAGQSAGTYYNSNGQVLGGTIDVALNPGKYYLVLDNSFSIVTAKVVTVTFYTL